LILIRVTDDIGSAWCGENVAKCSSEMLFEASSIQLTRVHLVLLATVLVMGRIEAGSE
jgi:hypothetical protein